MKNRLVVLSFFFISSVVSTTVLAKTQILDSLKMQGVQATALDDADLNLIKGAYTYYDVTGASVLTGQPTPSVTRGMKTNYVTYKGWGSYSDYSAYNYIGYGWSTSNDNRATYSGGVYSIAGDRWMADTSSAPNAWQAANAHLVEYHFQVLDPNTSAPTTYAFRNTAWNRPITKFSW